MSVRRAAMLTALGMLLIALVAAGVWIGRSVVSSDDRIEVAGDVRADIRVVAAPPLVIPVPDLAIGIPVAPGPAAAGAPKTAAPATPASAPRVAGLITTVTVSLGDHVAAGDVLATLDTTMLDLGVEQALLALARARAEVGVLDSNLADVADNRTQLLDARDKLAGTRAQLLATQAQLNKSRTALVTTRTKALAARTELVGQIARLERLISDGAATSTPPAPTPQQTLAAMKAKLAQLDAGIAKLNAGLSQIDAGLAKVAAGLTKLSSARTQIASGESALDSAVVQLGNAKDVLRIMADARALGVDAARLARNSAVITAPVSGTIAFARTVGSVAMVGAPLFRIRPDGASIVDTYLTAEQLLQVSLGNRADVSIDSFPDRTFRGSVTRIGSSYRYPPNTFSTPLTHMTRAAKVTITLEGSAALPFGTPADIVIHASARN